MIILAIDTGISLWYSAGRGVSNAGPDRLLDCCSRCDCCRSRCEAGDCQRPRSVSDMDKFVFRCGTGMAGRLSHLTRPQNIDEVFFSSLFSKITTELFIEPLLTLLSTVVCDRTTPTPGMIETPPFRAVLGGGRRNKTAARMLERITRVARKVSHKFGFVSW